MPVPKHHRPPAVEAPRTNEPSVVLTVATSELDATVILAKLRQAGIRAGRGAAFYVPGPLFDDLRIHVLERDHERARQVLAGD